MPLEGTSSFCWTTANSGFSPVFLNSVYLQNKPKSFLFSTKSFKTCFCSKIPYHGDPFCWNSDFQSVVNSSSFIWGAKTVVSFNCKRNSGGWTPKCIFLIPVMQTNIWKALNGCIFGIYWKGTLSHLSFIQQLFISLCGAVHWVGGGKVIMKMGARAGHRAYNLGEKMPWGFCGAFRPGSCYFSVSWTVASQNKDLTGYDLWKTGSWSGSPKMPPLGEVQCH